MAAPVSDQDSISIGMEATSLMTLIHSFDSINTFSQLLTNQSSKPSFAQRRLKGQHPCESYTTAWIGSRKHDRCLCSIGGEMTHVPFSQPMAIACQR